MAASVTTNAIAVASVAVATALSVAASVVAVVAALSAARVGRDGQNRLCRPSPALSVAASVVTVVVARRLWLLSAWVLGFVRRFLGYFAVSVAESG